MDLKTLMELRQSERGYSALKVEFEKIMQCIETARLSPSACNAQPWKFVIVDEPDLKNKIADAAASVGMNKFTYEAPIILAVVLEKPNVLSKIGSVLKNKEYTLIDIGIAVNNFCLQATELGMGTCIVGWFDEGKVKKILGIPKNKRIPLLITLGKPSQDLRPKNRKNIEAIYSKNQY